MLLFHCCWWVAGGWWWWLVLSSCWPILSSHRRIATVLEAVWSEGLRCREQEGNCQSSAAGPHPRVCEASSCHCQAYETATMQAVYLAVCFQNLQDFAIKSPLLLSFYFSIYPTLPTLYEHEWSTVILDHRRNTIVTQLFHSSYSRQWIWDLEWRHLQILTIEDKHSLGNAWNMENIITESSPQPHLRPCIWLHHGTGCCHHQRNCYRELQTICTGHNRD